MVYEMGSFLGPATSGAAMDAMGRNGMIATVAIVALPVLMVGAWRRGPAGGGRSTTAP
jgi:hypothetical protein